MPSPRNVLGPLTTAWAPPPICTYAMAGCSSDCGVLFLGQSCNPERSIHDWTDSGPPRSSGIASPSHVQGWVVYSPAYSCPQGYITTAVATAAVAGRVDR